MAVIDTLEELDEVLQPLLDRGLVIYLTEPDRRGAIVSHGFHSPEELVRLKRAPRSHAGFRIGFGRARDAYSPLRGVGESVRRGPERN